MSQLVKAIGKGYTAAALGRKLNSRTNRLFAELATRARYPLVVADGWPATRTEFTGLVSRLHALVNRISTATPPKLWSERKYRNAAQNCRASSCVTELEGVSVGGAAPFFECRISCRRMFFPQCFPIVPVISHAAMSRRTFASLICLCNIGQIPQSELFLVTGLSVGSVSDGGGMNCRAPCGRIGRTHAPSSSASSSWTT